ncbi:MAG: phosphate ABC transporter substrate-binding protein [Anaerolineae bacterium]|nr:phosphate ABC transporter substrate-binding protein [Anaerolineae bacterium]
MKHKWFAIVLLVGIMIVTACTPPTEVPPEPTEEVLSGRITFAGSTTVQPLADILGQAFREQHPDVELEIAAGGSVVGIEAVHNGTADIGMASRALTDEEAAGIEVYQIAVDVIAVVVQASNPLQSLTLEQLQGIYRGEITNWSELGGDDLDITVVMRGENSGTRGAFDGIVLDGDAPTAPSLETAVTAGDMAAIVGDNPGAIGYVGFGNIEADLELVSIDGVMPSAEAARNGSYRLVRPLLLLTGPLTQPLARRFVEFALSDEGQQIVADSDWIPAH